MKDARSGRPGDAICAAHDAAPAQACPAPHESERLLARASALFVRAMARPGPRSDAAVAAWLMRSPCHRCAWARIRAVWESLPGGA